MNKLPAVGVFREVLAEPGAHEVGRALEPYLSDETPGETLRPVALHSQKLLHR